MRLGFPLIPAAWMDFGSSPGSTRPRLASALIMAVGLTHRFGRARVCAELAVAGKPRDNDGRKDPKTIWQTIEVTKSSCIDKSWAISGESPNAASFCSAGVPLARFCGTRVQAK